MNETTRSRIRSWASFAKWELEHMIEQHDSLDNFIAATIEKGDISFVLKLLPTCGSWDVALRLDEPGTIERLKKAQSRHKLATFSADLKKIWKTVLPGDPDEEEVVNVVRTFFNKLDDAILIHSATGTPSEGTAQNFDGFQDLIRHWQRPYVGPSCNLLRDKIREYDEIFSYRGNRKYYSKALTFVQSSGTGKTRLASEYGRICPLVMYVLREPGTGFPPSDEPVYRFMRKDVDPELRQHMASPDNHNTRDERTEYIWYHAAAVGVLQATFEHCMERMREFESTNGTLSKLVQVATGLRDWLGDIQKITPESQRNRAKYSKRIEKSASRISASCVKDKWFRAIFNESNNKIRSQLESSTCESMKAFRATVEALEAMLKPLDRQHDSDPLFTIVFDEVSSLMGEAGNGRFIALNRIISTISESHKIWCFFLSTESKVEALLPPDGMPTPHAGVNRPSLRLVPDQPPLSRYAPFTMFAVDTVDLAQNHCIKPALESMNTFSEVRHMSRFGRPLWTAYDDPDLLARAKLLGGKPGYSLYDRDHAFAVLSNRLCLDVNLANPLALPLSQTAVHLHMRVVKSLDPSTGILFTRTPAEPVLALAAMGLLCESSSSWPNAVHTFTSELLSLGVIDKGVKGELFARLVLTLAHDCVSRGAPSLKSGDTIQKVLSPFEVHSFLHALLPKQCHDDLNLIDPTILNAHMNFLTFSSTSEHLTSNSFHKLCHGLLRRSSALQSAPTQALYDLFIPFYFGELDQSYNMDRAGAILVQIKNKKKKSSPALLLGETFRGVGLESRNKRRKTTPKKHNNFIFNHRNAKLLYILLDLGVDEPGVSVSYSSSAWPQVWAIHVTGHNAEIFSCIKTMKVGDDDAEAFFRDSMKPSDEDNIAFNHDCDLLDNTLNHDVYDENDVEE